MSDKKLGLILLSVALVLIAGFGIMQLTKKKSKPTPPSDLTIQEVVNQQQQGQSKDDNKNNLQGSVDLTTTEVKKHNTGSDCWTIISGKVYDITKYISNHPGGNEILRACGTDATTLFVSRTTSDGQPVGSGTPHSENAQDQLNQFLLGDLKQ